MARARNIKPGFFQNEELAECSTLERLAFIGMWTIADFKGCIEFRPKRLKVQLMPYDECDFEEIAINLEKSGFVRMYSVNDQRYLKIINFEKHQNPHKNERESGSDIPDIPNKNTSLENIQINPDKDGTAPADSLIPITDSIDADGAEKAKPASAGPITLQKYLDQCKADSVKPIPDEDTVFDFAIAASIPVEFVFIAWQEFKTKHLENKKRQKDWRQTFRNCVRSNWYKVWYKNEAGEVLLTSQGRTLQEAHKNKDSGHA